MILELMDRTCNKCDSVATQNYCPQCGQPQHLKRVDRSYILSEFGSVLNLERGILYTIKELLLRPGQNIKVYLTEDRSLLVKPIMFVLITSLFYTLVNSFFQLEDRISFSSEDQGSAVVMIFNWIKGNYGYTNILTSVFVGGWLRVFFRKYSYNIYEIIILLCFTMGIEMLLLSFFDLIQGVSGLKLTAFGIITGVVYMIYAIGQFYAKEKPLSYVKALIAYIFGVISFSVVWVVIGIVIEIFRLKY